MNDFKIKKGNYFNHWDKLDDEEILSLNVNNTITSHLGVRYNPEVFEFEGDINEVVNYMQVLRNSHLNLTRATGYTLNFYLGVAEDDWNVIHIYIYWRKNLEDFCGPIKDLKYAMLNYYNRYISLVKEQHAESILKVIGEMNDK